MPEKMHVLIDLIFLAILGRFFFVQEPDLTAFAQFTSRSDF